MNATKELPVVILKNPSKFVNDKRRDGWELLENVPFGEGEISLRLDEFLKPDEPHVSGDEIMKRAKDAKEMGSLAGQLHAERLLDQQSEIPEEWRRFVLIFPGTSWRNPVGYLRVPSLAWGGHRWDLYFRWLAYAFPSDARLVRLGK